MEPSVWYVWRWNNTLYYHGGWEIKSEHKTRQEAEKTVGILMGYNISPFKPPRS